MTDQKENNKFTAYAIGVCDSIDELRQLATVEEDFVFPLCYCIGKSTLENRSASVEALTGKSSNEKIEEVSQEKEVVHNTSDIDRDILSKKIASRIRKQWTLKPNYEEPQDISTIIREELPQSTKGNTLKSVDVANILQMKMDERLEENPGVHISFVPKLSRDILLSILKEYGTEK